MSFSTLLLRCLALVAGLAAFGCASLRNGPARRYPSTPPTPALATAPAPAPARPAPAERPPETPSQPIREELDIVYGQGGDEDLHLDLYVPENGRGPLPAIVLLHGGGWCTGTKNDMRPAARAFAEHGYVAVTVQYRLAPQHRFPAQLHDAKCAVRWLRANVDRYQVDPERIGVLGGSAGGHLALLVGLTEPKDGLEGEGGHPEQSSKVQAVINMMGPTDLNRSGWPEMTEKMIAGLLGGSRDQEPTAYRCASPASYVRRGAPPVLTLHGTKDSIVPYEQAQLLHASLRAAGATTWLEPMKDKGHGGDLTPDDMRRYVGVINEFLTRYLKPR
ncbi:MAG TPA: alpha/beta hydrolase [Gemmataceae bacterium]|jgi:acetyl esterase/lipase